MNIMPGRCSVFYNSCRSILYKCDDLLSYERRENLYNKPVDRLPLLIPLGPWLVKRYTLGSLARFLGFQCDIISKIFTQSIFSH